MRLVPFRSLQPAMLLPGIRIRFAVAVLLTFFPCGILFPFGWPIRELITLMSWVAVVPTFFSLLPLVMIPFLGSGTYGYFAFNLLCFGTTLGIAKSVFESPRVDDSLRKDMLTVVRVSMGFTFFLATWQAFSTPEAWQRIFDDMSLGDGGRGGGLRTEPSLLAAPLMLYLALLVSRLGKGDFPNNKLPFLEMLFVSLYAVAVTRSLSVLLIVICFLPLLGIRLRNALVALPVGAVAAFLLFADRLKQAFADTGGSLLAVGTVGVASWRNVPDLLMILNYQQFLFPGKPGEIREQISSLALLWDPSLSWLQNTYSSFSAGAATTGIIATVLCFIAGIVLSRRVLLRKDNRSATWLLLYLANWFITPKFELAGWVALGFVTIAFTRQLSLDPAKARPKKHRAVRFGFGLLGSRTCDFPQRGVQTQ